MKGTDWSEFINNFFIFSHLPLTKEGLWFRRAEYDSLPTSFVRGWISVRDEVEIVGVSVVKTVKLE